MRYNSHSHERTRLRPEKSYDERISFIVHQQRSYTFRSLNETRTDRKITSKLRTNASTTLSLLRAKYGLDRITVRYNFIYEVPFVHKTEVFLSCFFFFYFVSYFYFFLFCFFVRKLNTRRTYARNTNDYARTYARTMTFGGTLKITATAMQFYCGYVLQLHLREITNDGH